MKKLTAISVITATILTLLGCGGGGNSNDDNSSSTPNSSTNTIEKRQKEWLKSIPSKELISFGFMDRDELNQTKLGEPLKVYALLAESVNKYKNDDTLELNYLDNLKYPIIIKRQIRSLLTFSTKTDKVVGLGEAQIANQLNSIENYLGTTENLGLVMVFKESMPLLFVWQESSKKLVPLSGARGMLEIDENLSNRLDFNLTQMIPILKNYLIKGDSNESN